MPRREALEVEEGMRFSESSDLSGGQTDCDLFGSPNTDQYALVFAISTPEERVLMTFHSLPQALRALRRRMAGTRECFAERTPQGWRAS